MNVSFKYYAFALLLVVFIAASVGYLHYDNQRGAEEIISTYKSITDAAANTLANEANQQMMHIWDEHLKDKSAITRAEERNADSLLSLKVSEVLDRFDRIEGGIYFYQLDKFIGYGFPDLEEPKPAFGPPPRSYNIIRDQVLNSISEDKNFTELHRFDPAIFPLSTKPLKAGDETIGAVWTRRHIERELTAGHNFTGRTFFLTVGLTLIGFVIALNITWYLKSLLQDLKTSLSKMKNDPSYRLPKRIGITGIINRSINELMDSRQTEENKRKQLQQELYQKEKMATLGNLVAGAAHEINTPISIIKSRLQIWERRFNKLPEDQRTNLVVTDESLQIVHTEIERVSQLVKRLLLMTKPVGKFSEPVDLNALIRYKTDWVKEVYPERSISIQTNLYKKLPLVEVDPNAIDQVLMNVLKNAVESSDDWSKIDIETMREESGYAVISIRDYGKGIPRAIETQIFDPFFTTKDDGTGLGLSISYEIIKAHGGSLELRSLGLSDEKDAYEGGSKYNLIRTVESFKPQYTGNTHRNTETVSEVDSHTDQTVGTVCIIRLPYGNSAN